MLFKQEEEGITVTEIAESLMSDPKKAGVGGMTLHSNISSGGKANTLLKILSYNLEKKVCSNHHLSFQNNTEHGPSGNPDSLEH